MHPEHEKHEKQGGVPPTEKSAGGEMDGQRIMAQMHTYCTQYRLKVRDALHKLKEQEYAAAKVHSHCLAYFYFALLRRPAPCIVDPHRQDACTWRRWMFPSVVVLIRRRRCCGC